MDDPHSPLDGLMAEAFPGASLGMKTGRLEAEALKSMVFEFIPAIDPNPLAIYGFGSAFSGGYKPYSDIDLLIISEQNITWKKHCALYKGFAFEVQQVGSYAIRKLADYAIYSGHALAVAPIATATILEDRCGKAESIRRIFQGIYARGPTKPQPQAIDNMRAMITSRLVEMATNPVLSEKISCGLSIYEMLVTLICIQRGTWIRHDKWVPRILADDMSLEFGDIAKAYRDLFDGNTVSLIELARRVLNRSGGALWAGHCVLLSE